MDKCIIDPQKDCLGVAEAALLQKRIEALEEWRNKSDKFHEVFYDYQREQIARDAKIDEQLKNMSANLDKLISWQENQQAKPAERWNGIIDKVVMLIVGAVMTFFFTQIGL